MPKGAIPFNMRTKEEMSEIGRKGALTHSDKRDFALLINASRRKLCRNCKVDCIYKTRNIAKYSETVCHIPRSRAQAMINNVAITDIDDVQLKSIVDELLRHSQELYNENPDKELGKFLFRLVLVKEKFFPAVQKSLNANINMSFDEMYEKWLQRRAETLKKEEVKDDGSKVVGAEIVRTESSEGDGVVDGASSAESTGEEKTQPA